MPQDVGPQDMGAPPKPGKPLRPEAQPQAPAVALTQAPRPWRGGPLLFAKWSFLAPHTQQSGPDSNGLGRKGVKHLRTLTWPCSLGTPKERHRGTGGTKSAPRYRELPSGASEPTLHHHVSLGPGMVALAVVSLKTLSSSPRPALTPTCFVRPEQAACVVPGHCVAACLGLSAYCSPGHGQRYGC